MAKNKKYSEDEFRRYWSMRSEKALWKSLKDADDLVNELKKYYDEAHGNIQNAIDALYGKFADENGVPKEKAMEIIKGKEYRRWRMRMEEYLEAIVGGQALILELNALCMRKRTNRLEAIEGEIMANMAVLADVQAEKIGDHLEKCINRSYYESMYGFYKNKDPAVLALMEKHAVAIDKKAVHVILSMPWSGANYSSRIWKREYNMAKRIKEKVVQNILIGTNINTLSAEIARDLKLDSDRNVRRLLHTETAYVKGQADLLLYEELGFEEYELLATLDKRTSSICRKMDGKHYPLKEAVEGETYPPFHPNCRTTTIAYRENKEGKTRTARDVNGNSYDVPLDMTYDAWHKTYVETNPAYMAKEKAWKNRHADKKQFAEYIEAIGRKNVPSNFEKFQELKYNNVKEWEELKQYKRSITSGELTTFADFRLYKKISKEIDQKLVGLELSNNVVVKGKSYHFINRVIGSVEQKRNGVSVDKIKQSIQSEVPKIMNTRRHEKGTTQKLRFENNEFELTVNVKTGRLVQVNPWKRG